MATLQTRLENLATRVAGECKAIRTLLNGNLGDNAALLTAAKASLVAAINELVPIINGKQEALGFTPENAANKGQAGGYASLDGGGKVPSGMLPGFVDDVLEFPNLAAFPGTGTAGILYVAADTSFSYRWSGSAYAQIVSSPGTTDAVAEGAINLYHTTARAIAALTPSLGNPDTDLVAVFNTGLV